MPTIEIDIPQQHVQRVYKAYKRLAGRRQTREFMGGTYQHTFIVERQQQNETPEEFVTRAIKQSIREDCKLVSLQADHQRYLDEMSAIEKPKHDVTDDVVS